MEAGAIPSSSAVSPAYGAVSSGGNDGAKQHAVELRIQLETLAGPPVRWRCLRPTAQHRLGLRPPVLSVDPRDGSVRTHVAKHLLKGQTATALLVVETLRD